MPVQEKNYLDLLSYLKPYNATLIAVSKKKSIQDIQALYDLGQRDFGENYVQELIEKKDHLPNDIRWHFIGHLQSNKVKQILPFIHLIHSIDRLSLLEDVNKQAKKLERKTNVLLQMHIAQEETKFGLDKTELENIINNKVASLTNIHFQGLMGMASFSVDEKKVQNEFSGLANIFEKIKNQKTGCSILSMGMSGDYKIALECGSNMIRIGSLLFGSRN